MSNTDTGDTSPPPLPPIAPREPLISSAVTFLQNNNVKRSPFNEKQRFLRSKGMTENEIQIACERAGVFTIDPNSTVINMGIKSQPTHMIPPKTMTLQRIKDVLSSTALIAGITYAIYLFYKNYIEPLLFGRKKKKKTVEERLDELNVNVEKNIGEISLELGKIKEEVSKTSKYDTLSREINNFKSDLDAIKGLLLNRKQFSSPVVPPSIPVWQLQSQRTHAEEVETDKNDDIGSGSGSSEAEVVTKNSDSSLELIS